MLFIYHGCLVQHFGRASFTADCKTITLVYHLVPNIQDGGRKPEVQITFL